MFERMINAISEALQKGEGKNQIKRAAEAKRCAGLAAEAKRLNEDCDSRQVLRAKDRAQAKLDRTETKRGAGRYSTGGSAAINRNWRDFCAGY